MKKLLLAKRFTPFREECFCCCFLDLTFSSPLLSTKIADIPCKYKYERIIKPIFENFFGIANDQEAILKEFTNESSLQFRKYQKTEYKKLDLKIDLAIDWIRDETFIYDQIFELGFKKMLIFAIHFGLWKNRSFVLKAIEFHYLTNFVRKIDTSLKYDSEILMAALKENQSLFPYDKRSVFDNDIDTVKRFLKQSGRALRYVPSEMANNEEVVSIALRENGYALCFASEELRNNKELVLLALETSSEAYFDASSLLKNDRDVIFKALSRNTQLMDKIGCEFSNNRDILKMVSILDGERAMKYASNSIRNETEFAIQAIQQNPLALGYASDELRNNRELAIQAITNNSMCFKFLSEELKNDREIVKLVAMQDCKSLEYASAEFQDDEEIAELALKHSRFAFFCISDRLKNNMEFLSKSMIKRGYYSLPNLLIHDRDILLESIKLSPLNFITIANALQNDREFILQLVKACGVVLEYLSEEFKQDREIVLVAVTQNGTAIDYAANQFFDDEEIVLIASDYKMNYHNGFYRWMDKISERLRNNRQFMAQVAKRNMKLFFQIYPARFKLRGLLNSDKLLVTDRALVIRVVKSNGLLLEKMCYRHRSDRVIVSFAVQQNKNALKFASFDLRNDTTLLG